MNKLSTSLAVNQGRIDNKQRRSIDVDYIKRCINPADFYRYELPDAIIRRYGWNGGGLCPFHSDSTAGSFRINAATGAFKCYSCGTKGGDIISFKMALNGLNFIDALTMLADDWGLV